MDNGKAGSEKFAINIPNILSLLRVLLTPLFAILLIRHRFGGALLVFALAALSDGLDGLAARVFRQYTTLGSYLDPVADKLLLVTAFITLGIQELIPSWLVVIVISRDVVIVFGVALFFIIGREFYPKPALSSKITTVAQIATVFFVLAGFHVPHLAKPHVREPLFWITAGMTMISGLQYILTGLSVLQKES